MHALVVEDKIFNEILKVDIKMTMSMELEIHQIKMRADSRC